MMRHTCIVWKMELSCPLHRQGRHDELVWHLSVIDTMCKPIRELFTSEYHHLSRYMHSNYTKKCTFQDHFREHEAFSIFQVHFQVQFYV